MGKLQDILLDSSKRPQVIADCAQLVDEEVASKGGLSGLAVKGGYAVVKKIKPGIVPEAVDRLLNDFVAQLDSFHSAFVAQGGSSLSAYLQGRAGEVATALLNITDAKVSKAENRTIKTAYEKLRPTGAKHVEAAVPGIARVLSKYV